MSQPFAWWKDYYAAMLWQGNYDTLEEIQSVLDDLIEKSKNSAGRA